jgi:Uma2 family endonuclease
MASAVETRPMTAEEFLDLEASAPDDVSLELIRGEIRERLKTTRGPRHSTSIARTSQVLANWLDGQPDRDGEVAAGEVRCRIVADPETIVGLDVAYFEGIEFVQLPDGAKFYDGPPVVAVEALSPSDTHEDVSGRIRNLLAAGVCQVWVADPEFRTVTVYRADAEPRLYAAGEMMTGGPELPGFECLVARLFGRVRATR